MDAPIIAYFDSNVFDHVEKGIGCTDSERIALETACKRGDILIPLSMTNVEEIAAAAYMEPERVKSQLRLMYRLCDISRIVKPVGSLLDDDLHSFGAHGRPSKPFLVGAAQASLLAGLRKYLMELRWSKTRGKGSLLECKIGRRRLLRGSAKNAA